MSEIDKIKKLFNEFVDWTEEELKIDISSYDQDTTPHTVWKYLTTGEITNNE